MKSSLWKRDDSILRVLDERENEALVIDCIHPVMPTWIQKEELLGYKQIEESAQFMRFSTEYEYAPEEVQSACSKYVETHPGIILELEYTDHDEEVFQRIRFKGKCCECHDAAYHFMPFEGITIPKEEPPLPVIEFEYGSYETEDKFSLMVLLNRTLSEEELDSLEDSIASYTEANTDYGFEELIHDVLGAENIEHWIISPMRTYRV